MKFSDPTLELLVNILSSTYKSDTAHPEAPLFNSLNSPHSHPRMIRKAQVVICTEVQNLPLLHCVQVLHSQYCR